MSTPLVYPPKFFLPSAGSVIQYEDESWDEIQRDPRGLLLCWEPPRKSAKYIVALDSSEGITGWDRASRRDGDSKTDNGAIEVFHIDGYREFMTKEEDGKQVPDIDPFTKRQRIHYKDVQVAEFAAPCDAVEIARIADIIGRLYCGDAEDGQAELIWEAWPGCGLLATQELLRRGYGNLWHWEHIDGPAEETNRLGWRSSRESMKLLWTRARRHLMQRNVVIRSKWLLEEYADAEIDMDKMRARACFLPDTPVLRPDGWTPIKDVTPGSLIINRLGDHGKVLDRIENHFTGNLVGISPNGFFEAQYATPRHWIYAKPGPGKIYNRNATWVKAGDLKNKDCVFIPRRKNLVPTQFTDDQLWVMGFWLAEGNLNKFRGTPNAVIFNNPSCKLLRKAHRILNSWFPVNEAPPRYDGWVYCKMSKGSVQFRGPRIDVHHGSKMAGGYLSFGSYQAASFFHSMFGEYAESKSLPPCLMSSSGLLPLIAGYFDGDGTQRENQERDCSITTISYALATQVRRLLLDHGVWCSLQPVKRIKKLPNRQEAYIVNIKANEAQSIAAFSERMNIFSVRECRRIEKTKDGYWVPVSVSSKPYSGPVFDLSIEDEHSYVVESFAVHNSYGRHDDRFMAANLAFWAGHEWVYEESYREPVRETPGPSDFQSYAPGLDDEEMTFEDWKGNALADWD